MGCREDVEHRLAVTQVPRGSTQEHGLLCSPQIPDIRRWISRPPPPPSSVKNRTIPHWSRLPGSITDVG